MLPKIVCPHLGPSTAPTDADWRSFLPTSITASLIYFFLEVYVVCRLYMRIGTLRDIRVLRALSLVLLTLLTMVPDAIPTNTLTRFIPFTIASCMVLGQFCCVS